MKKKLLWTLVTAGLLHFVARQEYRVGFERGYTQAKMGYADAIVDIPIQGE